mgnify:CR=1 FL=1
MPVRVLSVATNIINVGAQNLIKSAMLHGENVEFIGLGETWGGWVWRMKKYKEAIALIKDDDIVVCIDAYDVLITNSLQLIHDLFKNPETKIIVSSDSWCFGRNCKYITTFHEKRKRKLKSKSGNLYVCMGVIAGRPRDLEKMYQEILDSGIQDDQVGLATFMENHAGDPGIELDDDEILACNVTGLKHFDLSFENSAMFTHFPSFVTWTGFSLNYRNQLKKHTTNGKQYVLLGKYRKTCQYIGLFILILIVLKFFM